MLTFRFSSLSLRLIFLIVSFLYSVHSESVLEFPTCGRKAVTSPETCISPENDLITNSAFTRTDIECLEKCQRDFPDGCTSAYRDTDGTCHLLDDPAGDGISSTCSSHSGTLMELITKTPNNNCGTHTCADEQICIEKCHSDTLPSPICLADDRDQCDLAMQFLNARQYWNSRASDSRDTGTVWSGTYPKMRHDAGLRIMQHMSARGHYQEANKCNHWYITFNGNKCTSPETIEQLDFSESGSNFHRASDIEGTCWDLPAGDILVATVIGPCDGYGSTDGYAGWNSARTTIIMEVVPTSDVMIDAAKSCPSSIAFNYQYYSWNEEKDLTFDASNTNELIKSVIYTKTASDTSLRLKYNALISVRVIDSGLYYCGRWFFAINGTECDPQADVVIHQSSPDHYTYWRHHRRVRTVEGICDNALDAGVYSIEIWVGSCTHSAYTQPSNIISGGFDSPSRIHVQEVRKDRKVDAIYGPNWRIYKSMFANIEHWQWYAMNSGTDNGDILSVTYYKEYADTGLRLTASGDHRNIYLSGSYSNCGRWYFKIDGSECSNPGAIEGVSYFNYHTNVHQPMQVSGVCHGIAVGSRTVTYAVGLCNGYSYTDATTGWQSSFHIFAEELRLDLVKDCGTSIPVNCDD